MNRKFFFYYSVLFLYCKLYCLGPSHAAETALTSIEMDRGDRGPLGRSFGTREVGRWDIVSAIGELGPPNILVSLSYSGRKVPHVILLSCEGVGGAGHEFQLSKPAGH